MNHFTLYCLYVFFLKFGLYYFLNTVKFRNYFFSRKTGPVITLLGLRKANFKMKLLRALSSKKKQKRKRRVKEEKEKKGGGGGEGRRGRRGR